MIILACHSCECKIDHIDATDVFVLGTDSLLSHQAMTVPGSISCPLNMGCLRDRHQTRSERNALEHRTDIYGNISKLFWAYDWHISGHINGDMFVRRTWYLSLRGADHANEDAGVIYAGCMRGIAVGSMRSSLDSWSNECDFPWSVWRRILLSRDETSRIFYASIAWVMVGTTIGLNGLPHLIISLKLR